MGLTPKSTEKSNLYAFSLIRCNTLNGPSALCGNLDFHGSRWFRKEGKKVELDTFSSQLSKGANIAICLVYVTRLKVTINSCIINKPIYSFSTYILIISKLLFSFLLGFIHEKDIIISFHRSRHLVLAMKLKTWI